MTITTRSPGASGCLFVVAAPSGGGKSSIVERAARARARNPAVGLVHDAAAASRRVGRRHYHFVDVPRFLALKENGEFLEHAFVHGNWYATSATWLRSQVGAGQDVLLEIDWQGAAQVRRLIPDSVHIFILPPSLAVAEGAAEQAGAGSAGGDRTAARRRRARRCATAASSIMLL